jgi:hypothetical protein
MENLVSIEYLAGLFDGEGTVTLYKAKRENRKPALSVSSTTYRFMELLKQRLGGSISNHKTYQEHYKQSWSWKVVGNKAIDAIALLHPYIQDPSKLYRMRHVLNNYRQVTVRNGKYTSEQLGVKLQFENDFFHPSSIVSTLT